MANLETLQGPVLLAPDTRHAAECGKGGRCALDRFGVHFGHCSPSSGLRPALAGITFSMPGEGARVADRVVVFLDYQNVYRGALSLFHPWDAPAAAGQIDPLALGRLLTARGVGDRELHQVRVYRGRPDSAKEPKTYAANRSQCGAWERNGQGKVRVFTRALRYPQAWPAFKAEEKGIDVALAVDFVSMAVRGEYDVGIIMSTDTDLKPALEAVIRLRTGDRPRCEVAAWTAPGSHARRLSIPNARLWCHWFGPDDYQAVWDPRDYTRAS